MKESSEQKAVSTELEAYSAAAADDCIPLENYCTWGGVSIEKLAMARRFPSILKGYILGKLLQEEEFHVERFIFWRKNLALRFPPPYPSVFPPVITVNLRVPFLY